MSLILIGGTKGGTGKTTIAVNIVAECVNRGNDVLFIDCDKQASASSWLSVRDSVRTSEMNKKNTALKSIPGMQKFGTNVNKTLESLRDKYDHIIIDAGGHDSEELRSALIVADVFYAPVAPTQTDIWSLAALDQIVTWATPFNKKLKAKVFINLADPNPSVKTTEKTLETIQNASPKSLILSPAVIKRRISYVHAIPEGKSVSEVEKPDLKAVKEITDLYNEMFGVS